MSSKDSRRELALAFSESFLYKEKQREDKIGEHHPDNYKQIKFFSGDSAWLIKGPHIVSEPFSFLLRPKYK